jgi:hypothetical protein
MKTSGSCHKTLRLTDSTNPAELNIVIKSQIMKIMVKVTSLMKKEVLVQWSLNFPTTCTLRNAFRSLKLRS